MANLREYHKIRKILIVIIGIVIVFGLGLWHHESQILNNTKLQRQSVQADMSNLNKVSNSINSNKIRKQYDRTQPNLEFIEKQSRTKLSKGIDLAYNKSQTSKKYRQNRNKVQRLLGNNIYAKVQSVTRPTENEAIPTYKSPSNKLKNYQISYGQYNPQNKQIPLNIMVSYLTPIVNTHADSVNRKPDYKRYKGYTVIDATLNTQTGVATVNDSYNQINGFSM